MSPPPRLALVGLGDAGRHHARALRQLHAEGVVRWQAACARDAARVGAFLSDQQAPAEVQPHTDYAHLCASGSLDAVILATPDGLHAAQIQTAAQAGLSVLAEKPLALDLTSARAAVDACQARGVVLGIGHHLRHHAGHARLRAELATLVGTPHLLDVRWTWPDPATDGWRARGQEARWWALAALGIHALDLAGWLLDDPAEPPALRALRSPSQGVDRRTEVIFTTARGTSVHMVASVELRTAPRLSIAGSAGEVEALGTLGARGDGTLTLRRGRAEPTPLAYTPVDPYVAQLRDFARALRGEPSAMATGDDGARMIALLERIDQAARAS